MALSDVHSNLTRLSLSRQQRETDAILAPAGDNLQGQVVGTDSNGNAIVRTNNGGILTAESDAFLEAGETAQISTSSGGTAQINNPPRSGPIAQAVDAGFRFVFKLAAPIIGTDLGVRGLMWLHEVSGELVTGHVKGVLYIWSPNNGFVQVGGAQAETNGYIEAPVQNFAYPLISRATFSSTISSFSMTVGGATISTNTTGDTNLTIGNTTATLSAGIGATVAVDGTLAMTATATDGVPIAFTVGYA